MWATEGSLLMGWGGLCRPRWCVVLGLLASVFGGAQGMGETAWLPGNYPNPIKYPEACGRGDSVGWICDPDNVLARDQADGVSLISGFLSLRTP